MELEVKAANYDDVFDDIARMHMQHRPGIRAGRMLRVTANGKCKSLVARGAPGNKKGCIWIDQVTRQYFGVNPGDRVNFQIASANVLYEIIWAWNATQAEQRIASRLGVLSVLLGLLGVALGGWSVWLTVFPSTP